MIKVHQIKPQRTCDANHADYKKYKEPLRSDFNKSCGYCDDSDFYMGGKRGFQIDHFKPQKHFIELEAVYSNLVYACPFCNRAKWDKWEEKEGFIDPCEDEYDEHLYRNTEGQICSKTPQGNYIRKELKLNLKRHELIWIVEKLSEQLAEINKFIEELGRGHEKRLQCLEHYRDINIKVQVYIGLYKEEI